MRCRIVGIIAWTVICLIIVIGLGVVVLYGHTFGHVKSILWIIAFMMSFGMAVLCIEPLKAIVLAAFLTLCLKRNPFVELASTEASTAEARQPETAEDLQWQHYRTLYAAYVRHKSLASQHVQQPGPDKPRMAGAAQRQQRLLAKYLLYYSTLTTDLLMFGVYLMTLLLIVLGTRDQLAHHSTRLAKDYVLAGKYAGRPMRGILTAAEFWRYLERVLVPTLHPDEKQLRNTGWLRGQTVKLIGVARLRQQRRRYICDLRNGTVLAQRHLAAGDCARRYDHDATETRTFSTGWRPHVPFTYSPRFARLTQPWRYQSAERSQSMPAFGETRLYDGGGYVLNLGRTLPNSRSILRYARRTRWLDRRTAVVFIELTLYAAQANLFNVICVAVERTAVGDFVMPSDGGVSTVRLLLILQSLSAGTILVFVAFVVCTVGFAVRLGIRLCGHGCRRAPGQETRPGRLVCCSAWMVLDTLVVGLSLGAIAMYMGRDRHVGELLVELEHKRHNAYVSFAWPTWLDRMLTCWCSALVAMATLRLWKLLLFLRVFRMCSSTLLRAVPALLWTLGALAACLLALALAACLLNGSESVVFGRSVDGAMVALLVVSFGFVSNREERGDIAVEDLMHAGQVAGVVLLLVITVVVSVFLVGVFVAIVCQHFGIERRKRAAREAEAPLSYWTWLTDGWRTRGRVMREAVRCCGGCGGRAADRSRGSTVQGFVGGSLRRNEERLRILNLQLGLIADMMGTHKETHH